MDNSRDADLRALHTRFHDDTLSPSKRQRAYRDFQSIQAQVKDRKLVELRYRLINAHRASDPYEAEKIEAQIIEHNRKMGRLTPQIALE